MAYKPTTGTSILDNDFRLATSEGVYEALQLKQDALPSQSGNADKVLVSDGSDLSWQYSGLGSGNFGTNNIVLGRSKPQNLTGDNCIIVGSDAGTNITSAISSNFFGAFSGSSITNSNYNNFFGQQSGRYATGANNTFIGHAAGRGAPAGFSGGANVGIGYQALLNSESSNNSTCLGAFAGSSLTTGNSNTFLGYSAGSSYTELSSCVAVGTEAGRYATGTFFTFIGSEAGKGLSGQSTGNNNLAIGLSALKNFTTSASNVAIGGQAGTNVSTGGQNVLVGYLAGLSQTTAGNCVKIGVQAGQVGNSSSTFAIGAQAGLFFTGSNTMALGTQALRGVSNQSTGGNNTAIGLQSGFVVQSGAENVLIGNFSGDLLSTGSKNLFIGYTAGDEVTTGSNNTILGDISGTSGLSDTVIVAAGTAERFRIDSVGNMGIGTSTPGEKLEVAGAVLATEYRVPNYRLDPHTHDEGTETTDFTINWANGAVHTVTLNAAGPLVITMSNPVDGGAYALRIIQGATPGTVTWPANVKWPGGNPPVLSTNTSGIDVVNLLYFDDGGGNTYYYATYALAFS